VPETETDPILWKLTAQEVFTAVTLDWCKCNW